jgi:hypothetical protein
LNMRLLLPPSFSAYRARHPQGGGAEFIFTFPHSDKPPH